MTIIDLKYRQRRPLLASEVADLTPGSACPVCHSRQLLIREIRSRLSGATVRVKQVYCPLCGSTGQKDLEPEQPQGA